MLNVNKLKVNWKKISKKVKLIIKGSVLTSVIVAVVWCGVEKVNAWNFENKKEAIIEYFGPNSEEKKVLDYIDISEKLNQIDFDDFIINQSLFDKYNISSDLKSPNELNILISNFNEIEDRISTKNIVTQTENIETILNLIRQESLVNSYIYTVGYSIAHTNVTTATKEYAGEVFGINSENIKFEYYPESTFSVVINNVKKNKYGCDATEKYAFGTGFFTSDQNNIKNGVVWMDKVDTRFDKNKDDNNKYNGDRNECIVNALGHSIKLYEKVEAENLYDKDMAGKLK